MKKTILLCIMVCILLAGFSVQAESTAPNVSYDNYSGSLVISGNAEAGSMVSLEILNIGCVYDDMKGAGREAALFHCDQTEATKDGYTFALDFTGTSGVYKALVRDYKTKARHEFEISLVNPDSYATAVAALNASANSTASTAYDDFKTVLTNNQFDLGFSFDVAATEEALSGLYAYIKANNLQAADAEKNAKIYKSYVLMSKLEDGAIGDVLTYLDDLYYESAGLKEDLTALKTMDVSAGTYTTQKLAGKTMTNLSELNRELKIACILGTVRYASGYQAIYEVLTDYGSLVGITGSISTRVCQQLNKNDYTADTIDDAYNSFLSTTPGGNPGGGGGGGGGGGFGGSPANRTPLEDGTASATFGSGTTDTKVEQAMIFTDLNDSHWAAESVRWMKSKGIVNGTDTGAFEPDRAVTREEFAKMLVVACGFATDGKTAEFSDAEKGAWYLSYIGAAVENGIVNGIGDNQFGIGQRITRQDMAVMVKRALDNKNVALTKVKDYAAFGDEALMAEYAKDAIKALFEGGIINGKGENSFDPMGNATRAEAAKIIYEALKEV